MDTLLFGAIIGVLLLIYNAQVITPFRFTIYLALIGISVFLITAPHGTLIQIIASLVIPAITYTQFNKYYLTKLTNGVLIHHRPPSAEFVIGYGSSGTLYVTKKLKQNSAIIHSFIQQEKLSHTVHIKEAGKKHYTALRVTFTLAKNGNFPLNNYLSISPNGTCVDLTEKTKKTMHEIRTGVQLQLDSIPEAATDLNSYWEGLASTLKKYHATITVGYIQIATKSYFL